MMPEMDGFELLSNLKGSAFFREIPIIILSGLSDSKDRIRCLELGANDIMQKGSYSKNELLSEVGERIKQLQTRS
jgi:PleD family two-component response regulator